MEQIHFLEDGTIPQVEMTSCGANGGPLKGFGEYPAYLACNLFYKEESIYTDCTGAWMDSQFPKITQDGRDGDEEIGYIANMKASATAGFKYFDCRGITKIKIKVRGYCHGDFVIKTAWDDQPLGLITVGTSNVWKEYSANISIPDGIHAIYITYEGQGSASLASFTLE